MTKEYYVESADSEVSIARRKGTRSLRLSVRSDGRIRLTIPYGVTERYAIRFLEEKSDWIRKHKKHIVPLRNGQHVGKSYRLYITQGDYDSVKTRIKHNEIHIKIPVSEHETTSTVQAKIQIAAEKALKAEAARLLPQRLDFLSDKYNLPYKSVTIKKLKSRWGSCDTHNNIALNTYLTQLDWKLIDYVLLHELVHTEHKHHQIDFWNQLEQLLPDYKERRRELKTKPTNVIATNF